MFGRNFKLTLVTALPLALLSSGCVGLQSLEPVTAPPAEFQGNRSVAVEFVSPGAVGLRCAERGATFFGLPAFNSGACADQTLVTMPNPCAFEDTSWYARALCHELGHVNGWAADHSSPGSTQLAGLGLLPASESPEALAHERLHESSQR